MTPRAAAGRVVAVAGPVAPEAAAGGADVEVAVAESPGSMILRPSS
jgi:hypothetical protein